MGSTRSFFKEQSHFPFMKLFPFTIFAILPFLVCRFYFYPLHFNPSPIDPPNLTLFINPSSSSSLPPVPPLVHSSLFSFTQDEEKGNETSCDYTNGKWVHDKTGPLYDTNSCTTIKEGQNCITHGKPDEGYLNWRWKPNQCDLPRFDPKHLLKLLTNKHLAFVGDSMARNQLESLLCMLTTASTPDLVYKNGEDNKFRKWRFESHNVTISVYWSPFLVKGIEKKPDGGSGGEETGLNYNKLYLDSIDERWGSDLESIDMIVLSIGHWFLHPAVYYDGDTVLGCHSCNELNLNYTEIGFFEVFRKAVKTTLKTIVERRGGSGGGGGGGKEIGVVLTTFSPSHFEGRPWDSLNACNQTQPYKEEEKELEITDLEMRRVEVEEVESMKVKVKGFKRLRLEALDVTKLSSLRPDGHPGPYMYPFPFANGIPERVHNDCLHWCLPGPVDTWNEILLDVWKRWSGIDGFEGEG